MRIFILLKRVFTQTPVVSYLNPFQIKFDKKGVCNYCLEYDRDWTG